MEFSHIMLYLVAVLCINNVLSKRLCRQDSDCSELGKLTCIKDTCDSGICGCGNGYASKYLGWERKFECVKMRKIGDQCSDTEDKGVCAPDNSHCSTEKGVCTCDNPYVPIWDGEKCVRDVKQRVAGETCSRYGIGTCGQLDCENNRCECIAKQYLELFINQPFYIAKTQCTGILHGEMCAKNYDCPESMKCNKLKFICECFNTTGHVPNYDLTICKPGLKFGANCTSRSAVHCDGSKGLECGDVCAVGNVDTCTCGPRHTKSGNSCTAIAKGDKCYGDGNCKGWSRNSVCKDGLCADESSHSTAEKLISIVIPLIIALQQSKFNF